MATSFIAQQVGVSALGRHNASHGRWNHHAELAIVSKTITECSDTDAELSRCERSIAIKTLKNTQDGAALHLR
jgi:hypothetical protein